MAVQEKQSFINTSTLIPISLVITLIAAAAGFGNFVGTFNEMRDHNAKIEKRIERLEDQIRDYSNIIYRIEIIEGRVESNRERIEKK